MQPVTDFLSNAWVAPLWALIVVAALDFALAVYRAIQQGVFDSQKLPALLDTMVLRKVLPLAAVGVAAFALPDGLPKSGLLTFYTGGCALALAAAITSLTAKATGSYVATKLTPYTTPVSPASPEP